MMKHTIAAAVLGVALAASPAFAQNNSARTQAGGDSSAVGGSGTFSGWRSEYQSKHEGRISRQAYMMRAPFDSARDFKAVFLAVYTTSVLVVNDRVPARTLAEFVAFAKARPGVLNYASSGIGSANHMRLCSSCAL